MSGVHKEQLEQSVRGRVAGDEVGERRSERQVRLEPPHTHTLPERFRAELGQHLRWGGSREPSKEVTAVSGGRGWWLDLGGGRGHAQIADILVNVPAARKCSPDGSSCHTLRARCVPPYRSRPGRDLTAEENGLGGVRGHVTGLSQTVSKWPSQSARATRRT